MLHTNPKHLAVPPARLVNLYLGDHPRQEPLSVAACVRRLRPCLMHAGMSDREIGDLVAECAVARGFPVVLFDLGGR